MGSLVQESSSRGDLLERDTGPADLAGSGSVTGPDERALARRPAAVAERTGAAGLVRAVLGGLAALLRSGAEAYANSRARRREQRLAGLIHSVCRGSGECLRSGEAERGRCPWAGRADVLLMSAMKVMTDTRSH